MRVGMLAPISWRVPPRHYGPWEYVVSLLTEGLVRAGVEVTLFATADSLTTARLASVVPRPLSEDPSLDAKVWECLHISQVFERAREFDLLHSHLDFVPLTYSGLVDVPMVTTIHGFSSERILPVYHKYSGSVHFVSISDSDRHPDLQYAATVHHGIDLDSFEFCDRPDAHLTFFGRIHPDKGVAEAIQVARAAGMPLVLAGIIDDQDYFDHAVKPHLDDESITYIGSVGPDQRDQVLGRARGLLHLVNFDEPFGLSMIEAMACGTPVIAFGRGSIAEIVRPGVNGFIVGSVPEAIAAVGRLTEIDRAQVRRDMEDRFSRERMVRGYLEVYEQILAKTGYRRERDS